MGRKSSEGTVTIKDIAAMCGVSISTVSNVLNGKTNKVSEDVSRRITEVVEKTGYKPNILAKSLRATSTKTIGVIAEDLVVFSAAPMIEGIMNCCEAKGYNVVIENMRLFGRWAGGWLNDKALFQSALQPAITKIDSMNVDGIIYVGGHEHTVENFKNHGNLPQVMAYAISDDENVPNFRLDDVKGGYDVIKYLLSMGHEKIGIIAGEPNNNHTIHRIQGIQKAMFEAGKLFDPSLIEYKHWTKRGGYDGMKALADKDISAVFCLSDLIASGAYQYLYEIGKVPGKDISIMGYDNQDISESITPSITTMALPLEELGYKSAEKLLSMIEENVKECVGCDEKLSSVLIERESVKKI